MVFTMDPQKPLGLKHQVFGGSLVDDVELYSVVPPGAPGSGWDGAARGQPLRVLWPSGGALAEAQVRHGGCRFGLRWHAGHQFWVWKVGRLSLRTPLEPRWVALSMLYLYFRINFWTVSVGSPENSRGGGATMVRAIANRVGCDGDLLRWV